MTAIQSLLPHGRNAWILAGGVVGIVVLGSALMLGPVRHKFESVNESISLQEKKLARNLAIVAPGARESVEKEYRRYGSLIKKRGSSDEENSAMLSEVDKLAGQNKVILSATKPKETRKDRDSESYVVEIEIEADMAALMGFLYGLEASPQLLRVDRLVLDAKGGKDPASMRGTMVISKVVTL